MRVQGQCVLPPAEQWERVRRRVGEQRLVRGILLLRLGVEEVIRGCQLVQHTPVVQIRDVGVPAVADDALYRAVDGIKVLALAITVAKN